MYHGNGLIFILTVLCENDQRVSNLLTFVKVGDPKQLPATVLSNIASKFLFECSMFERLQRAGHPVIMLTEQVMYLWIAS